MSHGSVPGDGLPGHRSHWERLGASYNDMWQPPGKQLLSRQELDFVGRHVGKDCADALDVGIGNGRVLDFILRQTEGTHLYGVDFAEAMVEVCRSRFADEERVVDLALCDVTRGVIPFHRQFGFISAVRILKYSSAWADVLAGLVENLVSGGTVVFSMPNRLSINRFSRPYAVPWYMTTPNEVRARCRALGTEVVEMRAFPRLPYAAYERIQGPLLSTLLVLERAAAACSDTFLGRELFVAARKA